MKITQITVPSGVYFMDLSCTLGSIDYVLTLRFNERAQVWMCDMNDSTGTLIVAGMCLRSGRNALASYYSQPSIPRGALFVFDTTGANTDPGKDSFSTTHQLLFIAP